MTKLAPALRRTDSQLLTIQAAAHQLNVSIKTIRRRIDDGQLSARRFGRVIRIDPDELHQYLAQHRTVST